jgi:hypothetical protein
LLEAAAESLAAAASWAFSALFSPQAAAVRARAATAAIVTIRML